MRRRWFGLMGSLLLAGATWANEGLPAVGKTASLSPASKIALEQIASPRREQVKDVIERALLSARGPGETFACQSEHYLWFLDHPDRAVIAWRRLGARCVSIVPRGQNAFSWTDDNGSEVIWETVLRTANQRVWYADGKVKAGPLLPAIPVKAVVVLRYHQGATDEGTSTVTQQATIYIHTDSKSLTVVTKLLGNSAQRLVESGMEQLQLFFSGVSWYMQRHPEQVEMILKD
jgi:hypothetical protein